MKINRLLSELKRRLRGVGEMQQVGSQISVKGKYGVIGGICFIAYNVGQLSFSVQPFVFPSKDWDGSVCKVHL
jgi:hypothetical protein